MREKGEEGGLEDRESEGGQRKSRAARVGEGLGWREEKGKGENRANRGEDRCGTGTGGSALQEED